VEKAKKLIALSEVGERPFKVTKARVYTQAIADAIKAAEDGVDVSLDEFPVRIHMRVEAPGPVGMETNEEKPTEATERARLEPIEDDVEITVEEEQTTAAEDPEESVQVTLVPDADPNADADEVEVQSPATFIKSTKRRARAPVKKSTSRRSKSSTPMKAAQTQMECDATANCSAASPSPRREIAVQTDDFDEHDNDTADGASSDAYHMVRDVENPPPHSSSKSDLTAQTTAMTTTARERSKKRKMICANELHAMPSASKHEAVQLSVIPVPGPRIALTPKVPTSDAKMRAKAERSRADFSPLKHTFDFETDDDHDDDADDGGERSPRPPIARVLRKRPKRVL
jgi:hypothetical protein